MLRAALCVSVSLACTAPSLAQQREACAGGPGLTAAEYIDTHRPEIVPRKLSNEERADAKKLMEDVRAALMTLNGKGKDEIRPTHATLDRLAVYGATGDREIMRTLMDGYAEAPRVPVTDNSMPGDAFLGVSLAGYWATRVWQAGDRSKPVSKALADCLPMQNYGKVSGYCGFDADFGPASNQSTFNEHWTGKKGNGPTNVTFSVRKLTQTPEEEWARFKIAYDRYVGGWQDQPDRGWAYCWAKRQGPEMKAMWDSKSALASDNYTASIENEKARKQAEIDKRVAEWTTLQAKRVEAKSRQSELSDADYGKWVGLSFWLEGKYLEPYASEIYLEKQTMIDSLCRAKPGIVCDRQRKIYDRLAEEARMEAVQRDMTLRNLTLGGSSTAVRSYDSSGNYLGTTSMPSWQADILKGN